MSLREDASAQSTYLQTDIGGVQTNTSSSHLSPELVLYEESIILGLAVFTVPDVSQMASVIRCR